MGKRHADNEFRAFDRARNSPRRARVHRACAALRGRRNRARAGSAGHDAENHSSTPGDSADRHAGNPRSPAPARTRHTPAGSSVRSLARRPRVVPSGPGADRRRARDGVPAEHAHDSPGGVGPGRDQQLRHLRARADVSGRSAAKAEAHRNSEARADPRRIRRSRTSDRRTSRVPRRKK